MYRNVSLRFWPMDHDHIATGSEIILQDAQGSNYRLGLLSSCPLQTLKDHPHLARRVRGVDFDFLPAGEGRAGIGQIMDRWRRFEDQWLPDMPTLWDQLEYEVGAVMEDILRDCSTMTQILFLYGPSWALDGLSERLKESEAEQRLAHLTVAGVPDERLDLLQVLAAALPRLTGLRSLTTDVLDMEVEEPGRISAFGDPLPDAFHSLDLIDTSPLGFSYISSSSHLSLTKLKLTCDHFGSVDLSAFVNLTTLDLRVDDGVAHLKSLVSPIWTPPASSSLVKLALSYLSPDAPTLPIIPPSVQKLVLAINHTVFNRGSLGQAVEPFNRDARVFSLLAELVRSRPELRGIKLVSDEKGGARYQDGDGPDTALQRLVELCSAQGIGCGVVGF